ncbi:MAG: glycosyltransferase family 4 protein [Leeuwenhoekiella sp.]
MDTKQKPVLIIVDLSVKQSSPAGSCVLSEIYGLLERFEIHLFSSEADQELIKLVHFHPIKAPKAVLVLRYLIFTLRVRQAVRQFLKKCPPKTLIQSTQGQYADCTLSYPHFSHRAYLQQHWHNNPVKGAVRKMRKLNHLYNAKMEASAFKRAKKIVAPSQGLKREISQYYPEVSEKITVISNPVDVKRFQKPPQHGASELRNTYNIDKNDIVIGFAALGDFERKGLSLLIEAISKIPESENRFKVLVVGGKKGEIDTYKSKSEYFKVADRVIFTGFQSKIEQFFWACDIFSLPSIYEIFPLVAVQAAAAGLPLLVTPIYGVEEYIEEGRNGWTVERNASSIAGVLQSIIKGKYDLNTMGQKALETVTKYDHTSFRQKWLKLYENELLD